MKLRRIANNEIPTVGEFSWHIKSDGARYFYMCCPTEAACLHGIPVHVTHPRRWEWDGNEDAPTLSPSIQCLVENCRWHGFVRSGALVNA